MRHRLADDVGAADHHRVLARSGRQARLAAASGSRAACRGPSASSPIASRPALTGWKPSTSLSGSIAAMHPCCVDVRRQRQLDEDAVDRWIGVEPVDQAAARPRWCRREACARSSPSPLRASPCPWSGHRPRSPGPRRPARPRGPARGRSRRGTAATSAATRARSAAAAAFPSISRAVMRSDRRRSQREPRRAACAGSGSARSSTIGEKSIPPKSGRILRIGR